MLKSLTVLSRLNAASVIRLFWHMIKQSNGKATSENHTENAFMAKKKKVCFLYIEVISSLANPLQTCQNVMSRYWIGKLVTAEVCECLKVSLCVADWRILASGFKERC